MDAITYGSLFLILGSTRLSVLTCCISENPGKHGFLSADAETQEELKDYLLYEEDGHIGLFVMLGETIKPLFYGTVTCMEVKAQGGRCVLHLEALTESYQMDLTVRNRSFQDVAMTSHQLIQKILEPYSQSQILFSIEDKTVRIEGKSRSWLMDREKHSRSFQNAKMTFQELAQEILANYKDADLIYAAAGKAVGSLIVQYEETDWEFLQRVLSREGIMITPDCRQPGLKLYAGVPELMESAFPCHILDMEKDMDGYYELKANGREVHASDFTRYTVVSEQLMGIFDPVRIQGNPFVVYACRYSFEDQEMQGTYKLQSAKGLTRPVIYPMHLIGVALNGNVVNVSGTKVQVAMAIDGNSRKRALYWFPYSTLSASSDGSGWYCMPEVGDDVRIYFPSKAESEAIALSAVSNYDAPQSGEDRMSDPDNRYLRTKSGQELALAPGYIKLSCGKAASAVTIQTDGKVKIQSQSMVKAMAQEEIAIHAEEQVTLHVSEQFIMHSLSGGQIVSSKGNVIMQGTEVIVD